MSRLQPRGRQIRFSVGLDLNSRFSPFHFFAGPTGRVRMKKRAERFHSSLAMQIRRSQRSRCLANMTEEATGAGAGMGISALPPTLAWGHMGQSD